MARTSRRTPEEIDQLLAGYEESGSSRRQYCDQVGIAVTTLDYYRQRQLKAGRVQRRRTGLMRVKLAGNGPPDKREPEAKGFALVLANGRRIEGNWSFAEQDLARLIRIVEAA